MTVRSGVIPRSLAAGAMLLAVTACGTSNVQEFKQRGPEYTLPSKMKYDRLGECLWQENFHKGLMAGTLYRNDNVQTQTYRISFVRRISFGGELFFVIEVTASPKADGTSLVTVYALRGLWGSMWPKDGVQEDINRCEDYSS